VLLSFSFFKMNKLKEENNKSKKEKMNQNETLKPQIKNIISL